MPVGLAMPVGVGPNGGAKLAIGSDNDDKIIRLALLDDENENAFQQGIGLGIDMIFDINDVATKARIITKLRDIFRRFEAAKRYRLIEDTLAWKDKDGETVLTFKYYSLEADDTRLFTFQPPKPGANNMSASV